MVGLGQSMSATELESARELALRAEERKLSTKEDPLDPAPVRPKRKAAAKRAAVKSAGSTKKKAKLTSVSPQSVHGACGSHACNSDPLAQLRAVGAYLAEAKKLGLQPPDREAFTMDQIKAFKQLFTA